MNRIVVVDYDPRWPGAFETLRSAAWPLVSEFALAVEHVGSTAVRGLAAKPVIDLTLVVADDEADVRRAIDRLALLGYRHVGDRGIDGREAFEHEPDDRPAHHLYVCREGNLALRNHLAVRDYLRSHDAEARAYGRLKRTLAREHPNDIDAYIEGKTDFLAGILRKSGLSPAELQAIENANRRD